MNTEKRLRDALRAEANEIEPRDGWATIESRLGAQAVPRNRTRYLLVAAAAVLVLGAVAVASNYDRDKDVGRLLTNPGDPTTTVVPELPQYIWPIDYVRRYATPATVADEFARTFLGMPDPTVSEYRAGDAQSGEIDIRPLPDGGPRTTLLVRHDNGTWNVVSARSANLQLDSPEQFGTVSSPMHLTGRSVAFEGTVHVSLYGYTNDCYVGTGDCTDEPREHPFIATTTFTGHGTELSPFEATFTYGPTPAHYGLLMLWTDSARDGSLAEATVILVKLGDTQTVPRAPDCNEDSGSGVRPDLIFLGCATSADYLTDIHWTSWTAESATGTATHKVQNCRPSCPYSTYDVNVTLSDPDEVQGTYVFRTLSLDAVAENPRQPTANAPCDAGPPPQRCTVPEDSWGFVRSPAHPD